jgi:hypothetical protein
LGFCKFQEGYVGLAFWILFAFLFAVEASLGGMDDDNWDWRMLETVSGLVWLRDREEGGEGYFDMDPGRRPPIAPSRPRVPTINESGEYISI